MRRGLRQISDDSVFDDDFVCVELRPSLWLGKSSSEVRIKALDEVKDGEIVELEQLLKTGVTGEVGKNENVSGFVTKRDGFEKLDPSDDSELENGMRFKSALPGLSRFSTTSAQALDLCCRLHPLE